MVLDISKTGWRIGQDGFIVFVNEALETFSVRNFLEFEAYSQLHVCFDVYFST